MSLYDSYTEELHNSALVAELCCECGCTMAPGTDYWLMTAKYGRKKDTFRTCLDCATVRKMIGAECFVPTQLYQELRAHRAKLSYDDTFNWAKFTNALAALQQRMGRGTKHPVPTYSPTPLRGARHVTGGWRG